MLAGSSGKKVTDASPTARGVVHGLGGGSFCANSVDLQAWLVDVLDRIADQPQNRLPQLPP